ncbi:MAG: 6-phosphogluconolactonase [Verrucomicrobiota bacterium]
MATEARHSIQSFPDNITLAEEVARRWIRDIAEVHEPVTVALSGGRISTMLLEAMAKEWTQLNLPPDRAHFFWADERCVPPDHPESNFAAANKALFLPLKIPSAHVHRIRAEMDPAFACAEAEAELCRLATLSDQGHPVLDWVFLGMGEDGHVASLFPGQEVPQDRAFSKVTAPKPPPDRITLTLPVLIAAKRVWAIISGAGKRGALAESLSDTSRLPFAQVIHSREMTEIFTDFELG